MLFSFFALIILYITAVEASLSHRQLARRLNHGFNKTRVPYGDDPAELVKRDGGKYIFMHHVRRVCPSLGWVFNLVLDCRQYVLLFVFSLMLGSNCYNLFFFGIRYVSVFFFFVIPNAFKTSL